ncbi:uncharacterized protein LOC102673074 [Apis dorsata]|uniref:uncharacterized protein LOC102673074 n=1 Tax=Apis dorsata TaxID=7462 RepID=UPI0003DF6C81|nr:uncharacterized protein LOC102673074 [Apis dorsata]
MKLRISVLLVALVAILLHSAEYTTANSICPRENCLDSTKCELFVVGATCPRSSDTCCSIVKSEYRTHCNHFAGECMDFCNQALQHAAVDCPSDKVCCTLI